MAFAMNTLTRPEVLANSVGHWVALVIRIRRDLKTCLVHFIDSLGRPVKDYASLHRYCKTLKLLCKQNFYKIEFDYIPKPIQHKTTSVCGIYVAKAIFELWADPRKSLKSIFKSYIKSSNKLANDEDVLEFLYKYWKPAICNNREYPYKIRVTDLRLYPLRHIENLNFCPKTSLQLSRCRMTSCKCNNSSKGRKTRLKA